jgi:hypothetical protein
MRRQPKRRVRAIRLRQPRNAIGPGSEPSGRAYVVNSDRLVTTGGSTGSGRAAEANKANAAAASASAIRPDHLTAMRPRLVLAGMELPTLPLRPAGRTSAQRPQ